MKQWEFVANDLVATDALGARLAEVLPDGAVVALDGPLGAGKTRLVQAIGLATGIAAGEITSPTFVLINEYHGRRPIYHFDAYRLRDDDEFLELGPDEYFSGSGLTLVEWAERVERCLPQERLAVRIETVGPDTRRFYFTAFGQQYEYVLDRLAPNST